MLTTQATSTSSSRYVDEFANLWILHTCSKHTHTAPSSDISARNAWYFLSMTVAAAGAAGRASGAAGPAAAPAGAAGARPNPGPTTGRLRATAAPGPSRGRIDGSSRRTRTDAGTMDVTVRSSCDSAQHILFKGAETNVPGSESRSSRPQTI